jgi:beta-ureidopropionase
VKFRSALVQMGFNDDRADNVSRAAAYVREAGAGGAQIICLPELSTSFYFCHVVDPSYRRLAESVPGPSTETMAAAAIEAGAYVIQPLYERQNDIEFYNTAVVFAPDGTIVGKHRKNSIPLVVTPKMAGIEKYYFRPGNLGFPVFETDFGAKFGINICYERHFPEGPRALALAGADIVFVPTATANGREIWEIELQGHAVANLMWVAGVNRVGRDGGGSETDFYGASVVVAPTGQVVAQASETGDEILYAEIDTDLSDALRSEWGFFRDRRPDLYGALISP